MKGLPLKRSIMRWSKKNKKNKEKVRKEWFLVKSKIVGCIELKKIIYLTYFMSVNILLAQMSM